MLNEIRRLYFLSLFTRFLCPDVASSYPVFGTQKKRRPFLTGLACSSASGENLPSKAAFASDFLTREKAQLAIDENIMPRRQYSERIGLGRDAQGIDVTIPLKPDDPRLSMTYAEFPLSSMDQLLDLALKYAEKDNSQATKLVDIGSGCGRLLFYAAMTRGSQEKPWDIHGIEIANLLHSSAKKFLGKSVEQGFFSLTPLTNRNAISLHLGSAEEFSHLFGQADIVFAYSTAFPAKSFSPELGAMILDPEWNSLLSTTCRKGCVAITTDRALDPSFGWELVDRLDVENPEVFGSTGYIHVLR